MTKIINFHSSASYLHRLTVLYLIASVGKLINADYLNKNILPIVTTLTKDTVANVRMNVAKMFKL